MRRLVIAIALTLCFGCASSGKQKAVEHHFKETEVYIPYSKLCHISDMWNLIIDWTRAKEFGKPDSARYYATEYDSLAKNFNIQQLRVTNLPASLLFYENFKIIGVENDKN